MPRGKPRVLNDEARARVVAWALGRKTAKQVAWEEGCSIQTIHEVIRQARAWRQKYGRREVIDKFSDSRETIC